MNRMKLPKKYMGEEVNIKGIPDRCAHKEWVLEWGKNLLQNVKEGKSLLLYGNSSTGKSAIGAMCLKALFNYTEVLTGLWVRARQVPEFIIEDTMYDDLETYKERMLAVDLLVIDEYMIFPNQNTFRQDTIEHIFRDRADANKSTIITTNMTPMKMNNEAYTFYQVIQEHCEILKITGHNFREK